MILTIRLVSPRRTLLVAAILEVAAGAGCGASASSKTDQKNTAEKIDDPCQAPSVCSASSASCVDLGDGQTRCEARCLGDKECGLGAQCLFQGTNATGDCFRTCKTSSDCAANDWSCKPIVSGLGQGFCLPPCLLSACTAEAFTYSCASAGSTSSVDQSFVDSSVTATVQYDNGHTVNCKSQGGHGSCHDDTGATCSF
jgi:hypothetical protein